MHFVQGFKRPIEWDTRYAPTARKNKGEMSRDRRRFADIIGDTARGRKLTVINAVNFTMAERLDVSKLLRVSISFEQLMSF